MRTKPSAAPTERKYHAMSELGVACVMLPTQTVVGSIWKQKDKEQDRRCQACSKVIGSQICFIDEKGTVPLEHKFAT